MKWSEISQIVHEVIIVRIDKQSKALQNLVVNK